MRRRPAPLPEFDEAPPEELLRFVPAAGRWRPEDFAAFLRARIAWRDTHVQPLPGLPARERVAMARMDIPRALVDAEEQGSRRLPPPPFRQGVVVDRPAALAAEDGKPPEAPK